MTIKTDGSIKVLDLCQRVVFLISFKNKKKLDDIKDSISEVRYARIDLGQGCKIKVFFRIISRLKDQ
jgi:hypothetical protein